MEKAVKLPSGNWRIRTRIDGQRLSFTGRSKHEAQLMAYRALNERKKHDSRCFGEAVEAYIDSKIYVLSPSTIRGYYVIFRNYLPDKLKRMQISDIEIIDLQKCINAVAKNFSQKTTANVKGLITATMRMFRPDLQIALQIPPKVKKEIRIPTDEEIRQLLHQATGSSIELPILLAAFGGLRRSEICALMPDCVHENYITVRRVLIMDKDRNWILKETAKTYAGNRDVPLPKEVMDLIHSNVKEGQPLFDFSPDNLYDRYQHCVKMAGLYPYKFHALRHYFASISHKMGIPDKYIMSIGGWSDASTLQHIYQHAMEDGIKESADKISNYFEKIVEKNNEGAPD